MITRLVNRRISRCRIGRADYTAFLDDITSGWRCSENRIRYFRGYIGCQAWARTSGALRFFRIHGCPWGDWWSGFGTSRSNAVQVVTTLYSKLFNVVNSGHTAFSIYFAWRQFPLVRIPGYLRCMLSFAGTLGHITEFLYIKCSLGIRNNGQCNISAKCNGM